MTKLAASAATPLLHRPLLHFAALVVMGAGWGGAFYLLRLARLDGGAAIGIAFWEGFGAGLMLLAVMLAGRMAMPMDRRSILFYTVTGFFGIGLPASFVAWSAGYLPVGVLAMTMVMAPILTYALSILCRVEGFSAVRAAGILAGFVGLSLVLLPDTSFPDPAMTGFAAIAFGSTLAYAIQNVYVARATPFGMTPMAMSAGTLLFGGAMLLPPLILTDSGVSLWGSWGPTQWAVLGVASINGVCTVIFLWMIRVAGPVFTSMTAYMVTFFGMLWGFLFFGEVHSVWIWAALLLLVAGVALVGTRRPLAPPHT